MEHTIDFKESDGSEVWINCDSWDGDGSTWLRLNRDKASINAILSRSEAEQLRDALNNILSEVAV